MFVIQVASICFLEQAYARILAEAEVDLAVSGVDRDHASGAVLQEAIGETAGGGADVEASFAGDVDLPMLKTFFELESAAAYVLKILAEESNVGVGIDAGAGLFDFLTLDQNLSGKDQRLRSLTRSGETAFEKQFIQPSFQLLLHELTTKVPAPDAVQSVELTFSE